MCAAGSTLVTGMPEPEKIEDLKDHPVYGAPGCGLAGYSCLLLIIFSIGMFGIGSATVAMLYTRFSRDPYALVPGGRVEVWRLQPMRDAGLLELTEIPLHYHDEGSNGSTACAMADDAVLRLDGGDSWRMPYADIGSVDYHREEDMMVAIVKARNGEAIPCFFEPGEGVERFVARMREQLPTAP